MGARVLAVDRAEQLVGAFDDPNYAVLQLARLAQTSGGGVLRWVGAGEVRMSPYMVVGLLEDLDALDVPPDYRQVFDEVRALAELVDCGRASSLRFVVD